VSPLKSFFVKALVLCVVAAGMTAPLFAQDKSAELPQYVIDQFGQPPSIPSGKLSDEVQAAVEAIFIDGLGGTAWGDEQTNAVEVIKNSGDPRLVWLLSDLMRFAGPDGLSVLLADATRELLDIELSGNRYWGTTTDHLIAWDIPAPPNYLKYKGNVFTTLVEGWDKIFVEGDIDWRHVSWGGVLIDDRPYDTTDELCNCIPAADNPDVISAKDAKWLDDDDIIFGIEVNGEYRAYPRQIMEVREMVNDTLGGRDLGIPYCTLCGAAQAYFTDNLPDGVERPVLRTSGLLIRSNKVMYDITSYSVFDTFLGKAVTGPLAEKGIVLPQASVVTTDWGTWKKEHPETTVLVEALALGRDFDFRNGRDANGPIFPVGNVDPRLPVHDDIVGIVTESGTPIAFPLGDTFLALKRGDKVGVENIELHLDSGGIRATDKSGNDVGSHQAFWFAWSQFYPETKVWPL